MSLQAVDFFVKTTAGPGLPLSGVFCKVLSRDGLTSYTTAVSDSSGKIALLLEEGDYQIRFFKQHYSIAALQFDVRPGLNQFDVSARAPSTPSTTDPRLCVAYGYFRTADGGKAAGVDVHFIAKFRPLLLDGDAVLSERVIGRTDANGFMQLNLIRNGQYDVLIEGMSNITRTIYVPDEGSVNLPDLLFPVVSSVSFTPAGPYAMSLEDELVLVPTVRVSDGRVLPGVGYDDVAWASSDSSVVALSVSASTLVLRAVSPGTAQINLTKFDTSIVRYPDPGVEGVPFTVTVT